MIVVKAISGFRCYCCGVGCQLSVGDLAGGKAIESCRLVDNRLRGIETHKIVMPFVARCRCNALSCVQSGDESSGRNRSSRSAKWRRRVETVGSTAGVSVLSYLFSVGTPRLPIGGEKAVQKLEIKNKRKTESIILKIITNIYLVGIMTASCGSCMFRGSGTALCTASYSLWPWQALTPRCAAVLLPCHCRYGRTLIWKVNNSNHAAGDIQINPTIAEQSGYPITLAH